MFSKGTNSPTSEDQDSISPIEYTHQPASKQDPGSLVVGQGVVLTGSLEVPDETRVSGSINGELSTKSLIVEASGHIGCKVSCKDADISGTVGDDLTASDMLILRSSSVISGSIYYKEMQIDRGAKITGKLIMLWANVQENLIG